MWRKDKIEDDLRCIDSHSWQTEDDKQEFTKAARKAEEVRQVSHQGPHRWLSTHIHQWLQWWISKREGLHISSQSGRALKVVTAKAPISSMKISGIVRPQKVTQKSFLVLVSLGMETVKSAANPTHPILWPHISTYLHKWQQWLIRRWGPTRIQQWRSQTWEHRRLLQVHWGPKRLPGRSMYLAEVPVETRKAL